MISSLYKDKQTSKFQEKQSQLVFKIFKGEKSKSVGMINLNLSDYIADKTYENIKVPLIKCPDEGAYVIFSITSSLINITSGSETMSMMSGVGPEVMSMGSGPESEFKFADLEKDKKKLEEAKIGSPGFKRSHTTGGAGGIPRAPKLIVKKSGIIGVSEPLEVTPDQIINQSAPSKILKLDKAKIKINSVLK